jgi:ectoine hydroxylase-related dioxygenase (phytanoyl-CoA dioxygenase family)
VLDGSHLDGAVGPLRPFAPRVVDGLGAPAAPDRIVALELEPGDLSLHHCLTFHRSGPNPSASARRTLIGRFFDAECRLVRERLPASARALFPTGEGGRLDERAFPLLVA